MNNAVTETELAAKATGRRVTLADVEGFIKSEHYFTAGDGVHGAAVDRGATGSSYPSTLDLLTFCVLVLQNGFTVVGQSACADPANFNEEIGRRIAKEDAVKKIWPLLGFALRSEIQREKDLVESKAFVSDQHLPTYVGTKVIHALPMNRQAYNDLRGWQLPADENGDDEGYLVEYTDRVENPSHVKGFLGYVSWSPKDVFERAYRPVAHG